MSRLLAIVIAAAVLLFCGSSSHAQSTPVGGTSVALPPMFESLGPPMPDVSATVAGALPAAGEPRSAILSATEDRFGEARPINPLTVLEDASRLIPGVSSTNATSTAPGGVGPVPGPGPASPSGLSAALNVMLLLTVVTLVPSIMLMTTSFVRILIVLGFLRQAMGTQSLPPAQVITALALFMTVMVMGPTIDRVYNEAIVPYQEGEIRDYDTLWLAARQPIRDFMFDQIEATGNWSSLYMVLGYQGVDVSEPGTLTRADISTTSLVPAYMLSELKVAFTMGFRIYLPFLVIDIVIASLLISMGMMMLPPVLISLPFKLLLFVLVDGWTLLVGSLLESFVLEGQLERLSADPVTASMVLLLLIRPVAPVPAEQAPRVWRVATVRSMKEGRPDAV